jgi:hypothetical protein
MIWSTLRQDAAWIRTPDVANYRRQDGFPPGTLADRFNWWSKLRSRVFAVFPVHIAILYLVVGGVSLACFFRPALAVRWPLYPVAVALVIGGAIEFFASALLDCLETARHLFIFHVISEMLIICAVAAVLSMVAFRAGSLEARKGAGLSDRNLGVSTGHHQQTR